MPGPYGAFDEAGPPVGVLAAGKVSTLDPASGAECRTRRGRPGLSARSPRLLRPVVNEQVEWLSCVGPVEPHEILEDGGALLGGGPAGESLR